MVLGALDGHRQQGGTGVHKRERGRIKAVIPALQTEKLRLGEAPSNSRKVEGKACRRQRRCPLLCACAQPNDIL